MKMKKIMVSLGVLFALLVMFGVNPAVAAEKEKFEEFRRIHEKLRNRSL